MLELPKTVPSGRISVCLVFDTAQNVFEHAPNGVAPHFPTIEELKAEGRRKAEARRAAITATGVDPMQKYCGCLKDVFDEDGTAIQRRMRDEWPD